MTFSFARDGRVYTVQTLVDGDRPTDVQVATDTPAEPDMESSFDADEAEQ